MEQEKHILVAVLNWGLGHATRMVPLIKELQKQGFSPVLASDGVALCYLQKQFPTMPAHRLPAYNIQYGGSSFMGNMLRQLPKIAKAIRAEHKEVALLAKRYRLLGILSDNRLGAYHVRIPCMYVTHQLNIKAGIFSGIAGLVHRFFIRRFTHCLVPDTEEEKNSLAGKLSHPSRSRKACQYIGPLSRFMEGPGIPVKASRGEKKYKACIVLSGPEPDRSEWEAEVMRQTTHLKRPFVLIRGTDKPLEINPPEYVKVMGLAGEAELLKALSESEVAVSRSGYSSIMDYCFLQTTALLVPTPGQGEQEYLAGRLKGYFAIQKQSEFDLKKGITQAKKKKGIPLALIPASSDWASLFALFQGK